MCFINNNNRALPIMKDKTETIIVKWMDTETIIRREINHTNLHEYPFISLVYETENVNMNINTQKIL